MKYIVEFEDEPCMYEDEVHFYKCIQAPWWGLSERVIKQLTPYQPDAPDTNVGNITNSCGRENDLISRQAAIEALAKQMPRSYTPDGSHPGDEEIFKIQEIYVDCIESIEILPAVQPDHSADISKKVEAEDCISRQAAIDAFGLSEKTRKYGGDHSGYDTRMLYEIQDTLENLPAVQPDHTADSGKKVCVDTISRQAALKKLAVYIHLIDKTMGKGLLTDDDCMEAAKSVLGEDELPAAQPEIIRCKDCKYWKRSSCCEGYCGEIDMEGFDEDHYCGFAERRTE